MDRNRNLYKHDQFGNGYWTRRTRGTVLRAIKAGIGEGDLSDGKRIFSYLGYPDISVLN